MTDLLTKVKNLKNTLLGLEMELDILESDLLEIAIDLKYLYRAEEALLYNINFLKQDGIIAVAMEYKKSVEQLATIKNKISKFIALRSKTTSKMRDKIKSKNFYQKEFNKNYKDLENNQILLVFKGKKGKNG